MTIRITADTKETRLTENERNMARKAGRRLNGLTATSVRFSISTEEGPDERVEIPPSAIPLFSRILDEMAAGNTVAVVALEHQRKDLADRLKATEALAEQAQALDMGY